MKRLAAAIDETIRTIVLPLKLQTTLASFKASVDADFVAAFDGWQGKPRAAADRASATQPWETIECLACLQQVDWPLFKIRLARSGENEIACSCGAHFLSAFLVRHRWTLIVLGSQSLVTPASELLPVRTTTIATLGRILPALDRGGAADPLPGDPRGGGDGGAGPAELGIPLWWVRGDN